jgi:ABC-2 type transport system permease protein
MNLYIREMKAHRKSLVFWCLGIFIMIISGMNKYSYYEQSGQSITELLSAIPSSLRAILGFGNFDVSLASGFYGMLFLYLLVMSTIHASMLGANIIAKEERDKTTEFLMVKPISRSVIVTSKLLAALTNIWILNTFTLIISILIVDKYNRGESVTGDILNLMVGMFILQVLFLLVGTGIAAMSKKPRVAASIATAVLLVAFMISIVIDMNSKLEGLRYLTPFKYFDAQHVMYGGGLDPIFVLLSVFIIVMLVVVTYLFYRKRDLNV